MPEPTPEIDAPDWELFRTNWTPHRMVDGPGSFTPHNAVATEKTIIVETRTATEPGGWIRGETRIKQHVEIDFDITVPAPEGVPT